MGPIKGIHFQINQAKNHLAGNIDCLFLFCCFRERTFGTSYDLVFKFFRGGNQRGKATNELTGWGSELHSQPFETASDVGQSSDVSGSCEVAESESQALQERIKWLEHHVAKKVVLRLFL